MLTIETEGKTITTIDEKSIENKLRVELELEHQTKIKEETKEIKVKLKQKYKESYVTLEEKFTEKSEECEKVIIFSMSY